MKTSKENDKSKKHSKADYSVKSKRGNVSKSRSNEDEIRVRANEIYLQRLDRGEQGTAEND